jgi:hypothetical protein
MVAQPFAWIGRRTGPGVSASLAVRPFLAQHPQARHGGAFLGRALHADYRAAADKAGLAALDYLPFVAALGPHITEAIWSGQQATYRLKPTLPAAERVVDRAGLACACALLIPSGIGWGFILNAVLP